MAGANANVEIIDGAPSPKPTPARAALKTKAVAKAAVSPAPAGVQPVMISPEDIRSAATVAAGPRAATPPDGAGVYTDAGSMRARLIASALRWIGRPYVWGGASPEGFDCSGFVQYAFASLGIRIPRTADDQFYALPPTNDPRPGDLVFFQTYEPGPSHVGIYLGNGYFVNSIGSAVQVSSFASSYFTSRYLGARSAFAD